MENAQFDKNMAIEDMQQTLQLLQHENNNMREIFEQLQVGIRPTPQNPEGAINQQVFHPIPQSIKELSVSLLEKFNGI